MSSFTFPILLDVSTRPILLVGGGAVAARKASSLLNAGAADVRCVSPAFHPSLPVDVRRIVDTYDARHLDGIAVVFALTDSTDVNDTVVRDATARGLLVARADASDGLSGDFTTPAVHRDGAITLAVSAAGSPAVAAAVRDELADHLDARWSSLAAVLERLRPLIVNSDLSAEQRREVLRSLATRDAMAAHAGGGVEGLADWFERRHPNLPLREIVLQTAAGKP